MKFRLANNFFAAVLIYGAISRESMAAPILPQKTPTQEVDQTLNSFHEAASKADGKTYFSLFAPEGVFIGTDASERWNVDEFKKYAEPIFKKGKGWTYTKTNRHIDFAPSGDIAWFDELLDNKAFGTCRGSGVLRKIEGQWRIAQYHLTFPVPNALAEKITKEIQAQNVKTKL